MDKSDFDRVISNKRKNRDLLSDLKAEASVLIFSAIVHGLGQRYVEDGVKKAVEKSGLSRNKRIKRVLAAVSARAYKMCQVPSETPSETSFSIIDRESTFMPFDKAASDYCRGMESREKEEILRESLERPEGVSASNVRGMKCFCVASRHDDCAEDHEAYQGKIYVKRWALRYDEIREYCERNGIKTVEWVTGKPVWLTTRPNCRHFMSEATLNDLESKGLTFLLKEKGMDRAAGTKAFDQTISHLTKKEWYTRENVKGIVRKYEDRLKKHERMAEVYENENIRNAIAKDKALIRKWKSYLAKIAAR